MFCHTSLALKTALKVSGKLQTCKCVLKIFTFLPPGDVSDDDHDTDEDSSEEDDETRSRGSRASNKGGTRRSSRKADRPAKSVKLTPGDSDAVS